MNPARAFLPVLLALLFPALAAENPTTLALGAAAPDFNLPGVDGRNWALKDFAGSKALVVIFTCNHCPTAQYYEDRIKRITSDYKAKGVAVVAISPNDPKSVRLDELGWTDLSDTFAEMKIRAKDHEFNFPYLYDGDSEAVSRAYGPVATPHAFVFDGKRKLQYVGAIDDSERIAKVTKHHLREALDAVLAEREPAVKQTKVVGCSVKWAGKEAQVKAYMEKLAAEPVSVAAADASALGMLRKNDSGKFRLINFWATWCAPCREEMPAMERLYRRHHERGFVLLAVSVDTDAALVRPFLEQHKLTFPVTLDAKMSLANAYGVRALPSSFLIDRDGNLAALALGPRAWDNRVAHALVDGMLAQ